MIKTSELLKLLKDGGCYVEREGKRHEIWFSPISGKRFAVGRHAKEIPTGTAKSILRDAGLE